MADLERNGKFLDNVGLAKLWSLIKGMFYTKAETDGLLDDKADVDSVYTKTETDTALSSKVDKETGKGLSTNDYTTAEKNKLAGIASGAEVNVQSDWNQTNTSSDDYIKNKPSVYTKSEVDTALNGKQDSTTITTSTATPADNDTVIMQASGTTNTTTFIRRTMSKIWDYIKSKADSVYNAKLTGTVGSSTHPIYQNNGTLTECNVNEYYVRYSDSITVNNGHVSPLIALACRSNILNCLEGIRATQIKVEYSADGGTTWVDAGLSNNLLSNLVADGSNNNTTRLYLGGKATGATTADRTAVTIYANENYGAGTSRLYAEIRSIVVFFNTGGTSNNKVEILALKGGEWTTLHNSNVNGNTSGWNTYPVNLIISSSSSYYQAIKLVFRNEDETVSNSPYVRAIKFIASRIWTGNAWNGEKINVLLGNDGLRYAMLNGSIKLRLGTSGSIESGNEYAVTGGTVYTALQGKQNTLTFDNAPTANSNNPVKSSGIKTALDGKIDYADTFVWTQPYNATAGSYAKVLSFPKGASLVLNITMTKYSNVSTSTVWLSASNSGQIKAWQLTDGGFAAPRTSSSPFLAFPYKNSQSEGSETLKIQVVRCSCALSELTFHDTATVATGAIELQSIYKRQVERDNALSFNLPTSGTQSVNMSTYNDFVGQMTEALETEAVIKLSNQSEGQVYSFTFTHNLKGGIAFTNSNASTVFCEIASEVPAGSTITLTSVSNTAGGWVAKVSNAGIVSSDGSVSIDWAEGVADLSVPVLPPNVVLNRAELGWENDDTIAIGYNSVANCASGDEDFPYAYTANGMLEMFKVDGGTSEYYHEVTAGTTYSITRGNTTISFTPTTSGKAVLCNLRSLRKWLYISNKYNWNLKNSSSSVNMYPNNMTEVGTSQYCLCVVGNDASMLTSSVVLTYWYKTSTPEKNLAVGKKSSSTSNASTAVGNEAGSFGSRSIAVGDSAKAYNAESVMIGSGGEARGSHSTVVGNSAKSIGNQSTAIGYNAEASGNSSTAVGYQTETSASYGIALGYIAKSKSSSSIAIGWNSQSTGSDAIAIGTNSKPNGNESMAIGYGTQTGGAYNNAFGYYAKAGYPSGDSNYPYLQIKRFEAVSFTENGNSKIMLKGTYGEDVTITAFGTTITTTPPNANCLYLIVVNDSLAPMVYRSVNSYAKVNGTLTYLENIYLQDIVPVQVTSNHYVFWFRCPNSFDPTIVTSFSFLCLYKSSSATTRAQAFGYNSLSTFNYSNAIGDYVYTAKAYQTVIGTWNIEDEYAKFIIGGGTAMNHRKNILTIDDNEVMHVRKVKEEGVYYCLDTSAQNIVMGDAIYVSGQDGQYIELPTSSSGVENGTTFRFVAKYACKIRQGGTIIADMAQGTFKEFLFIDGNWYVN